MQANAATSENAAHPGATAALWTACVLQQGGSVDATSPPLPSAISSLLPLRPTMSDVTHVILVPANSSALLRAYVDGTLTWGQGLNEPHPSVTGMLATGASLVMCHRLCL
jgi:hypothetical protein